jgi:hypothetical protein
MTGFPHEIGMQTLNFANLTLLPDSQNNRGQDAVKKKLDQLMKERRKK